MTYLYAFIFTALSSACLLLLVLTDLKRNRRAQFAWRLASTWRRVLALLSFSPLFILPFIAEYTALLVWLGAVTIVGWCYAVMPRRE